MVWRRCNFPAIFRYRSVKPLLFISLLLFCTALCAQTGTIKVVKPEKPKIDSGTVSVPAVWVGIEGFRGIGRFPQVFWPVNIDEERVMLRRAWGLSFTLKLNGETGTRKSKSYFEMFLKTGFANFQTHVPRRSLNSMVSTGLNIPLNRFILISGEIGTRYFYEPYEPLLRHKLFLETAWGLSFMLHPHSKGYIPKFYLPVIRTEYRMTGPHRFAYVQFDFPLLRHRIPVREALNRARHEGF